MSLFTIAWRSILQRGVASGLTALSMALGVMLVVAVLTIHGVLHILGHDHPTDATRLASSMWKRQERLLTRVMKRA